MKVKAYLVAIIILAAGCASKPPYKTENKQTEIYVLQEEIRTLDRSINEMRAPLRTNKIEGFTFEAENKSMDRTISTLLKTRGQLGQQYRELRALSSNSILSDGSGEGRRAERDARS